MSVHVSGDGFRMSLKLVRRFVECTNHMPEDTTIDAGVVGLAGAGLRTEYSTLQGLRTNAGSPSFPLREPIKDIEELDTLPFLSIIKEIRRQSPSGNDYGRVFERRTSGWQCIAGGMPADDHEPKTPVRVLWRPGP